MGRFDFARGIFAALSAVIATAVLAAELDLQREVDAAAARGGGVVTVSRGEWETKPFVLRSGVTLYLEDGAVVYASTNLADYASTPGTRCFIFADGADGAAIRGKGVVDGRGFAFREQVGIKGEDQPQALPVLMRFSKCRNLLLEGFTYRRGGAWGCHLRNCDGVIVRKVTCFNHVNNTNDGIDIESSNVLVEDCDIDADDDAIAFKTESDAEFPVTNVVVRNCRLASCCNALKFGTGSYGDFRDIRIENCDFSRPRANHRFSWYKTMPGVTNRIAGIAGLALEVVDGGRMENITIRNITMAGYMTLMFVRLGRRHPPMDGCKTYMRNILIERVKGVADSRIASSITGVPGLRPSGIVLRNIDLSFPGGGTVTDAMRPVPEKESEYPEAFMFSRQFPYAGTDNEATLPAFGFYLRHTDEVRFENVRLQSLTPDARPPIIRDDCMGFVDISELRR